MAEEDFLGSILSDNPAPTPEPQPEATPETQPETARVETPSQPVEIPATPDQGEKVIPLSVALNWRDEAKEERRKREAYEQANRPKPVAMPDPYEDPTGFAAWQTQQVETRLSESKFAMSDQMARMAHGPEKVEEAVAWAQTRAQQDPTFAAAYMREQHPIDWIVRQHKRDAMLSTIGDVPSLDDWFTQEAAKRGYQLQSAPAAAAQVPTIAAPTQPASVPVSPPRSLASAPSVSAVTQVSNGSIPEMDAIFSR